MKTNLPSVANSKLIEQWDFQKNTNLDPSKITLGSEKEAWWLCELGHSFSQKICNRSKSKTSCPICAKESQTSFYEQALVYYLKQLTTCINRFQEFGFEVDLYLPELKIRIEYDGEYWHRNKNSQKKEQYFQSHGLTFINIKENYQIKKIRIEESPIKLVIEVNPDKNFSNLLQKILSFCKLPSLNINLSEDKIEIYNQYITLKKENNLAKCFPEISKEWDYNKNGDLKPEMFFPKSGKKVWWKCKQGHSWLASIDSRTKRKHNCPYCCNQKKIKNYNDLYSLQNDLLLDWDFEKNLKGPECYAPNSNIAVWWKCHLCGFEQQAIIANRTKGHGCQKCRGDKRAIVQKDLKNNIIKIWNNLAQIELNTTYNRGTIRKCCNKQLKSAYSFIWSWKEENNETNS